MGKENESQEKRNLQAGRQLESSNADKILHNLISAANVKLATDKAELEAAQKERQAILAKIERKKADLERLKQRLDTLQKIRLVSLILSYQLYELCNYFDDIINTMVFFTDLVLLFRRNSKKPKKNYRNCMENI